ncbi:MAG: peptide ABC transporter substrate-binding protein, partial [Pseudomonadota bacterium]
MKRLSSFLMVTAAACAFTTSAYADGHEGKRGRDGEVKIIYWQAPSILNPFLSGGTKDVESASMIVE